jgi:DNA-binding LacI/PurR family transcriptional regulator
MIWSKSHANIGAVFTLVAGCVPPAELGSQAMRLLQMRIDGEGGVVKSTVLPVSLIIRQSCGCGVAKEE